MTTIVVPARIAMGEPWVARGLIRRCLSEKIEDGIHIGLWRNNAAQACVNDMAARFERGNVAQIARRIKYGPVHVDRHSRRCGRV